MKVSVHVLDGSGGNLLDACTLACMGAMKAFRRPDISVCVYGYECKYGYNGVWCVHEQMYALCMR
ncbi:MAG: hypothetical protein EOP64_05975 [Sphingomonas sp.]|nr:MAG: hypothetical protein EOP64_05975 [Sphingomonas sp.]